MNLYIDTEFDGYRGRLISLALVDKGGREFYEVLPTKAEDPWVAANVVPVLGREPISLNAFQRALESFLRPYAEIHVIADYPSDIQHFCWALETSPGERIATPSLTMEIRRDLGTSKSLIPHNALADARALRLEALDGQKVD